MNIKTLKTACKKLWQDLGILSAARLAITSDDPDGLPIQHLRTFRNRIKQHGLVLHWRVSHFPKSNGENGGEYEYILATQKSLPRTPTKKQWTTIIAVGQILHPDPSFCSDEDIWIIAANANIITQDDVPEQHRDMVRQRLQPHWIPQKPPQRLP